MTVESNWWESFFEGLAVELWLQALSPEHTGSEADTIVRLLCAAPGAELLDVPCGGGRLSLSLAERGYRLTGVDVSGEFLEHARSCKDSARMRWEHREIDGLGETSRRERNARDRGAGCASRRVHGSPPLPA
jgi:2-polyprenyl-3-methyl-5-hydroxy-6-metoxy-1,4-benzoquinol methylase